MIEIMGVFTKRQKYAELHVHSNRSKDARHGRNPQELVDIAINFNLSALAITDHDDITGSLIAKEYAQKAGFKLEVIPASEISTQDGHVIALYIKRNIAKGLMVEETVRSIHKQKGLAIAPHPLFKILGAPSLGKDGVLKVVSCNDPLVYWDGFEVYNVGVENSRRKSQKGKALEFYRNQGGLDLGSPIGGTDGHGSFPGIIVTSYVGSLKEALKEKRTGVWLLDREEMERRINVLTEHFVWSPPSFLQFKSQ